MRSWKVVASLLGFWLLILLYMSLTLLQTDTSERAERQLVQAMAELDMLKKQNEELKNLATELKDIKLDSLSGGSRLGAVKHLQQKWDKASENINRISNNKPAEPALFQNLLTIPSPEYEKYRRKVETDAMEFWYYLRSNMKQSLSLASGNSAVTNKLRDIVEDMAGYHRTMLNDIHSMAQTDGSEAWRKAESQALGDLVQNKIRQLQNPPDCKSAKKLVCNLSKGCGYGCQLHHVAYCLILALATERTFILESKGWRYAPAGWEKVFLPLSDSCTDRDVAATKMWSGHENMQNAQVAELPIIDSLHPRPQHLPLSVPEELASRLASLHGNPSAWWIGQIVMFLCRPVPALQKDIEETGKTLGFKSPIVGVHVRRTDKVGSEAAFHGIEEYMEFVAEYYDRLEQKQSVDKRRVYLASDDTSVLQDAKRKFPTYEFISDVAISKSAGLGTRYSGSSLRGIIIDIHFLSMSDYLVCTFSSQVCRVAYELMQTMYPDASSYFHSLDDIFYYGGQNAHNEIAIEKHSPRQKEEIAMEPGDVIGIAGNHWDGFSKGMNRRTGQTGLYPSYKVEDKVETAKFPIFKGAEKTR